MAKAKIEKEIEVVGETTELVTVEEINPAVLFGEDRASLDILLEKIKVNVLSIIPDVSTAKGRKAITANVSRVTKSKTTLEKIGKDYNATEKERLKKFDSQRKYAFTFLEDVQKEARKTLTEWEDKEKDRIAKYEGVISSLINAGEASDNWMNSTIEELNELMAKIEEVTITKRFQEFEEEAEIAKKNATSKISGAIADRARYEEEQAELKKLRKDAEEADRLRFEADQKAQAERNAQQKIIDANNEAKAAEQRAEAAEQQRIIDAENAEKQRATDKENAEAQRILDVEAAAQAERDRIEAEKQAEIEAEKKRAANKNHKGKINRAIVKELLKCGIDESQAKKVVTMIAQNKVPNIKISY